MARHLPEIGRVQTVEVERAWRRCREPWQRQRLGVIRLVAKRELSADEVATASGVGRATVFRYVEKFQEGGVTGLLQRSHKGGRVATLDEAQRIEFEKLLRESRLIGVEASQAWIKEKTGIMLARSTVYQWLKRAGWA